MTATKAKVCLGVKKNKKALKPRRATRFRPAVYVPQQLAKIVSVQ